MTPMEFCRDFWYQKTEVHKLFYLCKNNPLPSAVSAIWLVLIKILMVGLHVTWPRPVHTRCLLVVRQKYLTADCRNNSRRAYWNFYHRWTSDTISSLERSSVSTKQTIDRLDCEKSWIRRKTAHETRNMTFVRLISAPQHITGISNHLLASCTWNVIELYDSETAVSGWCWNLYHRTDE